MRKLAYKVHVLESRHGALLDCGTYDGSSSCSISDIDAAINDFLDCGSITSSGSTRSYLDITVTFDGGMATSDYSNGPAIDCGYGQDIPINTIVIVFNAGNSMKHRGSSATTLTTSLCEDEEEYILDGGGSNANCSNRPSMDCGNAGENFEDIGDTGDTGHTGHTCHICHTCYSAHTSHTCHTGNTNFICHVQNNYF